jgi:NAD(P)H dehydrogenase (quinone)
MKLNNCGILNMAKHLMIISLHRDEGFLTMGVKNLIEKLEGHGEEVSSRNLYELNFNPILTSSDFIAMKQGQLPFDIAREQDFIKNADYLWFIFPIWWTSMPAILKGYIDRVFLNGFAYQLENDRPVGLLTDKKVIILNSMGMSRKEYKLSGMFKAMELTIDKGVFEFTGMKVIAHKYFTSVMSVNEDTRETYLKEIAELADNFITHMLNCNKLEHQQELIRVN